MFIKLLLSSSSSPPTATTRKTTLLLQQRQQQPTQNSIPIDNKLKQSYTMTASVPSANNDSSSSTFRNFSYPITAANDNNNIEMIAPPSAAPTIQNLVSNVASIFNNVPISFQTSTSEPQDVVQLVWGYTSTPTMSPTTSTPSMSPTTSTPSMSPTTSTPSMSPITSSPSMSPTSIAYNKIPAAKNVTTILIPSIIFISVFVFLFTAVTVSIRFRRRYTITTRKSKNNVSKHISLEERDGDDDIKKNRVIQVDDDKMDDISTLDGPTVVSGSRTIQTFDPDLDHGIEPSLYSIDYDYTGAFGPVGPQSVSTAGATGFSENNNTANTLLPQEQTYSVTSYTSNNTNSGYYQPSSPTDHDIIPYHRPTNYTQQQQHQYYNENDNNINYDNDQMLMNNSRVLDEVPSISNDSSSNINKQTFTNTITIDVPPGKLGILLSEDEISDNNDINNSNYVSSSPAVQFIKEVGFLYNKVQIGDRLISVDGLYTSTMSTEQVCYLISSRSYQPCRRLVFLQMF